MAIGGRPAARALASKGMKPSAGASKATKTAFTKAVKSGKWKPTKNGVQMG